MKLLRFGEPGKEKPGCIDENGCIRDLSACVDDINGDALLPDALATLGAIDISTLPIVDTNPRLGPCVAQPGKMMCIGLNYANHAAEAGMAIPTEPILFAKFPSAICGPNDSVIIPRHSTKTDWEVELGVVIGKAAKHVTEADALDHVAGYCVINDVSEREWQLEGTGQWVKGKSCDTFGPTGPWMVTRDEIGDPQNLNLWLEVNGERLQDSSTSHMIFDVAALVSYLSAKFTLQPGDLISTGTPPGVGMGFKPPRYLKAGDTLRLGVEGLGEQASSCVDEP